MQFLVKRIADRKNSKDIIMTIYFSFNATFFTFLDAKEGLNII